VMRKVFFLQYFGVSTAYIVTLPLWFLLILISNGCSDIYFVCKLKPLSSEVVILSWST
jgi:hypothetical protein